MKRVLRSSRALLDLDQYLAALRPPLDASNSELILERAALYHQLVRHEAWQDFTARIGQVVIGLRKELEEGMGGKDRPNEIRAMLFAIRRVLDVPRLAFDAEEAVNKAIRRQGR